MRKVRYIIFTLVFFLIILFMKNSKAKAYNLPTFSNVNLGQNIGNVRFRDVVKKNGDFYCIDHTGTLTDKLTSNYKIVGYIEIEGTTVKAYSAWESGSAAPGTTIENVEYAPYVELGTGSFYQGGTPSIPGQKAQPYLKPAVADHADEYKRIIKDVLKG